MYFNMLVIFVYVDYIIVWFNVKLFLILSSGVYGFWWVDMFIRAISFYIRVIYVLCFVYYILVFVIVWCSGLVVNI